MNKEKLERGRCRTLNAHQADTLQLWDSQVHGGDRFNLTLESRADGTEMTVYGLTMRQLGDLYLEIARVLGKAPEPTLHHLQEIHSAVGKLLAHQHDQNQARQDPWA